MSNIRIYKLSLSLKKKHGTLLRDAYNVEYFIYLFLKNIRH
jgi:hypothetical protein